MPNPTITPAVWAPGAIFNITDSDFVALDVLIDEIDEETAQIILTVPAGGEVALHRDPADWSGAGTSILTGGVWSGSPISLGDWQVDIMPGAAVTDAATISLSSATSGAGGWLRVVLTGLAGQSTDAEAGGGTVSIERVIADPSLQNIQVVSPTPPVTELASVTISSSPAVTQVTNPAPTTAPPAPPTLLTTWAQNPANPIAVTDFMDFGATATFTAPALYDTANLEFSVTAAYDLASNATVDASDPQNTETLQVEIQTVTYGMVLVLDRSGSMGSSLGGGLSKWEATVRAAQAWADIFHAFRPGDNHRAGVITFEHDSCSWSPTPAGDITLWDPCAGTMEPGTALLMPLQDLVGGASCDTWDLGTDQSCTPIGDGMVYAVDKIGASMGSGDRGAIVLLTDGYENAGRVTIAATQGSASITIDDELAKAQYSGANAILGDRIYTLAVGSSVDEDRLNALGSAYYQQITSNVNEVLPAFAAMLGDTIDAQQLTPQPPLAADPGPAPTTDALYFRQTPGEHRMAFLAVWPDLTHSLRIGWRPQGDNGQFTLLPGDGAVNVVSRANHGMTSVDLHSLFSGPPAALEWRLQLVDNGGATVALPANDALVMVDLVTKVEVEFDQPQYFIGDDIKLTCRIRSGGVPVTNATVGIDCARPGEGLGTFLATNSPVFRKLRDSDAVQIGRLDPDQGKGLMFKTLLAQREMDSLPIVIPPQFHLFDDGTHGDGSANDGDYAGFYTDTEKEGTYTFRYRVEGTLADGSIFSRIFVRSTWIGVRPDPALLVTEWDVVDNAAGGMVISAATFRPQATNGELLGPFRDAVIDVTIHGGTADGPLIDNLDGSYTQRVLHRPLVEPVLDISIYGQAMKPTSPGLEGRGTLEGNCWKIFVLLIRCILRAILKFFRR